MRKLAVIVLMLLAAVPLRAQRFDKEHLSLYAGGRYSRLLDGHGMYDCLLDSYDTGGAGILLGIHAHPSDSSWWANAFNYPNLALGFSWNHAGGLAFKNGSRLGDFYNGRRSTWSGPDGSLSDRPWRSVSPIRRTVSSIFPTRRTSLSAAGWKECWEGEWNSSSCFTPSGSCRWT